jgi:hypothetical protein
LPVGEVGVGSVVVDLVMEGTRVNGDGKGQGGVMVADQVVKSNGEI